MCKKKCKAKKNTLGKVLGKIFGLLVLVYGALFAVFYFDLDGKALFYGVEPFLKKHYDNMPRKDMLKTEYNINEYPKYEYNK